MDSQSGHKNRKVVMKVIPKFEDEKCMGALLHLNPVKVWLDDESFTEMDSKLNLQIQNVANLPFLFRHLAIMSDTHLGYGMPIGGVAALDGVVSPNMVGVDIGCGMCAVKTSLTEIDTETLKKIMGLIRDRIPVGFNKHKDAQDEMLMPDYSMLPGLSVVLDPEKNARSETNWSNALKSLGTLGGGNHFIEIQKGDDGHIWIMIHSGSRNLGLKVAEYYNKVAIELNERWHSTVPKKHELAFLPLDSVEGRAYLMEMQYCIDFALANRKLMMERVLEAFIEFTGERVVLSSDMIQWRGGTINIAHNYAAMENHFGKNVMVHRKGATLAREGTTGIIPGSQGTKSYIVQGKGNPESFMSCSHGAGRRMGRKQAERELDLAEEQKRLDDKGILHAIRGKKDLDEAAGAYKSIETVMENQSDLVDILVALEPLAVVKG